MFGHRTLFEALQTMLGRRKRAAIALTGTLLLASIWAVSLHLNSPTRGAGSAVPDTLPAQLTDEQFWTFVDEFSEPNGYFRSDNLLSNEASLQQVIPTLKGRVPAGGAYIGVGPEQNFTYIVNLEPKLSFIVDIRRLNMLEHLLYKALFELSTDRVDFLSRLFSRARPGRFHENTSIEKIFDAYETATPDDDLFEHNLAAVLEHLSATHKFPLTPEDEDQIRYVYNAFFRSGPDLSYTFNDSYYQGNLGMPTYRQLMLDTDGNEPARNLGFLGTEEQFRKLQAVQRKNLIVPLVGDFAGPKTLRSISAYLKEHHAVLSVFYTSNVEMYLFQQDNQWKRFYENVGAIPTNDASTFVRFTIGRRVLFDAARRDVAHRSQMWSPVHDVLEAVRARKIDAYPDVIEMSH
jgi:hypothetical protein